MGLVYPDLPTVGSPNSTEQPKVRQSLIDLRDTINGAIAAANLATDSVSTAKIVDDAVTAAKIADSAVDGGAIASDAVTGDKLSLTNYTVQVTGGADVLLVNGVNTNVFTSTSLTSGLWLVIAEVDLLCEDASYVTDFTLKVGASTIGATRIQGAESGGADRRQRFTISALTSGGDVITLIGNTSTGIGTTATNGNSRMQIVRLG